MPVRPRHGPPPLEVMRGVGPGQGLIPGAGTGTGASSKGTGESGASAGNAGAWVGRSPAPTPIRVPRGYVWLLFGLIAILALVMYLTGRALGYKTGYRAGQADAKAEGNAALPSPIIPPPVVSGGPGPGRPGVAPPAGRGGTLPSGRPGEPYEPRQAGLNYYVLAHCDARQEDYIKRLLTFLWANGVDVAAIRRHNNRFSEIIALRGFSREELRPGGPAEPYRQTILRLGRTWAGQNRGGNDFVQMYLDLFEGEKIEASITKETMP